jgi:hypothetical protein
MTREPHGNQYHSGISRCSNRIDLSSDVLEALVEARDAFGAIPLTTNAISGVALSDEARKRVRRAKLAVERALSVTGDADAR